MPPPSLWTRRHFVARTAAATAAFPILASTPLRPQTTSQTTPQITSQTTSQTTPIPPSSSPNPSSLPQPLLDGQTARPLRYTPDALDFVLHNGRERFNRPLYGPSDQPGAFRIDAGDLPEFALSLPGHGGNLRLGLLRNTPDPPPALALHQAASITARYRPGRMLYEIRDPLLGRSGTLHLDLLTQSPAPGLHLRILATAIPPDLALTWTFGGVSGRRGRHNGDLGLEIQPVADFFSLDPEDCHANLYTLHPAAADLDAPSANLHLTFPPGARLHLAEASAWNSPYPTPSPAPTLPILTGSVPLANASPLHLLITHIPAPDPGTAPPKLVPADPNTLFADRLHQIDTLAASVTVSTPDPFLNTAVPALTIATAALWDHDAQSLRLGAVSDAIPAPGWRGPYALDALGSHQRMLLHLRHWIALQNTTPLPPGANPDSTATGPPDPGTHLTRHTTLLHTLGEVPGPDPDKDMSLVFFDAALRHLRWTGDLDLARELWPALNLHLDRQFRLFRRAFANPSPNPALGQEVLPLYESYATLWASDNLQFNGGGATHATALNLSANRAAATLARLLNEDPTPFEEEADLLREAAHQLLWLPQPGTFAESRDLLSPQTAAPSPALHALYHATDAGLATPRQAWQMAAERLARLRPVPVHGPGVPPGDWFLLPNSAWLPYTFPLTNLLLAENLHTALALWQAGMPDAAYNLFAGNLLDSMYRGLCPGNLHLTSALDPHRGETARDLGDPIGAAGRALVEGLFGVLPDLLRATVTLRPGFPSTWNDAQLHHPDLDLTWNRDGLHETLAITSRLPHPVALTLILPARTTSDPVVLSNGQAYPFLFDPDSTGAPTLLLTNFPSASAWNIDIRWHGHPPPPIPAIAACQVGDPAPLPRGILAAQLDDPQACLTHGLATLPGPHTVFARIHEENCQFWLPIRLQIDPAPTFSVTTSVDAAPTFDPIDLTPILRHQLTEILTRGYTSPRSPFCSLALPSGLLGGWKSDNVTALIEDTGLRSAAGTLHVPLPDLATPVPFLTPSAPSAPNTLFLSHWQPDLQRIEISLSGHATTLYLLITGTTFPQATHAEHGALTVLYTDGSTSRLPFLSPTTWWPIEKDYFLDDFLFRIDPPPPHLSSSPIPRTASPNTRTSSPNTRTSPSNPRTSPSNLLSSLSTPRTSPSNLLSSLSNPRTSPSNLLSSPSNPRTSPSNLLSSPSDPRTSPSNLPSSMPNPLSSMGTPLPPRIDLRSGQTRHLDLATFKGQGGHPIPGGAATLLHLPLHPDRPLASVQIECTLYGIVLAPLAITLAR